MRFNDVTRRVLFVLAVQSTATSCNARSEDSFGHCAMGIAEAALRNPASPTIASNIARGSGFAPRVDPNAPDLQTKQLEFHTFDGAAHFFAVQNANWERAALIRVVSTSRFPPVQIYVIDRIGSLIQATRVQGSELTQLSLQDPAVLEGFRTERELWREAGPGEDCGQVQTP